MKKKIVWTAAVLAVFCAFIPPVKVLAVTDEIKTVSVKVGIKVEAGDRLPEISIDDSKADVYVSSGSKQYEVSEAEWVTSSTKDMTVGEEPKMSVTLTPSDEYDAYFKSSYTAERVKISGGTYVSSKKSGSSIVITLRTDPVKGTYAEPEDVGWRDTRLGMAEWSKGDNTSGAYEVWLYRGKTNIFKKDLLKSTTYNFYPYMTEAGTYYYKIRSVPYKEEELKNGKRSEWEESGELLIRERDISDGTGKEADTATGTGTGSTGTTEIKEGWQEQSGIWYYKYKDGSTQVNSWMVLDDEWYRFDGEGKMVTGWYIQDGYIYYMNGDGTMQRGWAVVDNTWYYFYPEIGLPAPQGAAATGWQVIDGRTFFFSPQGAMAKGWFKQDDKWYYLNTLSGGLEGAMFKGWFNRDGKTYYTDRDGVMLTGWQRVDNVWYYFYPDGAMAADTVVDGYQIDEDGVWRG